MAGAGELVSFFKALFDLTRLSRPPKRAHEVVALPDSRFKYATALNSTAWHSLTLFCSFQFAPCVYGI